MSCGQVYFGKRRQSAYENEFGYFRGNNRKGGIDAPQRFGDSSFWSFDFGDSEIRWTWNSFTFGFGTQAPWIGPSYLNPILHSNNAPTYPKLDLGLRKTKVFIPYTNIYIGNIETRIWAGYLSESNYFDNDETNNHNMINGFSISYSPSFLQGLTLGATKTCISKWKKDKNFISYFNPFYHNNSGIGTETGEDQKASIFVEWISNTIGLNIYGEIGIDDYFQDGFLYGLLRYPFDSFVSTYGIKKIISTKNPDIKLSILFEISSMEEPRNRIAGGSSYSYNFHTQITQGYTNKGQYLSTYLANGGNSQSIIINIFYPKGYSSLLLQRDNPDTTYSFIKHAGYNTYKANNIVSLFTYYSLLPSLSINSSITFDYIINPNYYLEIDGIKKDTKDIINLSFVIGVKYSL